MGGGSGRREGDGKRYMIDGIRLSIVRGIHRLAHDVKFPFVHVLCFDWYLKND